MIVVTGIATVAPESAEALKAAARKMAAASREEAGCHAYAFYEDLEVAGRFRVYEEWESAEAAEAGNEQFMQLPLANRFLSLMAGPPTLAGGFTRIAGA